MLICNITENNLILFFKGKHTYGYIEAEIPTKKLYKIMNLEAMGIYKTNGHANSSRKNLNQMLKKFSLR